MIRHATADLLPISLARCRRLVACFSCHLQERIACFSSPSSLTFSAKFPTSQLKGDENKIFSYICMMFKKVISFIYETIYFGDRVPLNSSVSYYEYFVRNMERNKLHNTLRKTFQQDLGLQSVFRLQFKRDCSSSFCLEVA